MDITLIVKDSCAACRRAERFLRKLVSGRTEIILSVININEATNLRTQICPAIFINQELYTYGDIEPEKFAAYLRKKYEEGGCNFDLHKSN
jgi:hypothetical protein